MATYLFVHGAFHGGWCWAGVAERLAAAGHRILAPDLPGMGERHGRDAETSFAAGMEMLAAALDCAAEPVILCAHSLGGVYATQLAAERAERVHRLVYIAAYIPEDGQSCRDLAHAGGGIVRHGLQRSPDGMTATLKEEWIEACFYNDCAPDLVAQAKRRLVPQPLEPYLHAIALPPGALSGLAQTYVECWRDHAVPPGFQRLMAERAGIGDRPALDCGHSPFLNHPARLAALLAARG